MPTLRPYAGLPKSGSCYEGYDFDARNCRTQLEVKRNIKCQALSTNKLERGNPDDISRAALVWRAIKLPIYSVALVPLSVSFYFLSQLGQQLIQALSDYKEYFVGHRRRILYHLFCSFQQCCLYHLTEQKVLVCFFF